MSEIRFRSRNATEALQFLSALLLLLLVAFGLTGCKKKESTSVETRTTAPAPAPAPPPAPAGVQFSDVRLGNAIAADKSVTTATETFAAKDTIYASVTTSGTAPSASLRALWTFQDGQVVSDDTQSITPTGVDTTEFHISKPD